MERETRWTKTADLSEEAGVLSTANRGGSAAHFFVKAYSLNLKVDIETSYVLMSTFYCS